MKTPLAAEPQNGSPGSSIGWYDAEFSEGRVGDADPLQAIAGALPIFPPIRRDH
jgi:hypothetical protein